MRRRRATGSLASVPPGARAIAVTSLRLSAVQLRGRSSWDSTCPIMANFFLNRGHEQRCDARVTSAAGRMAARCAVLVALTTLVYPSASFTPSLLPPRGSPRAGVPPPAHLRTAPAARRLRPAAPADRPFGRVPPGRPACAGQRARVVALAGASSYLGDGFQGTAGDDAWRAVSGGVTIEMAEECSVEEAAGIASIVTLLMESCNLKEQRLPRGAADVLQALLSHPAGTQAFWTTFLTDPDLERSVREPFEPALVRSMERFPELNIGVLSSCLAMSATEEALFQEEGDEFMAENAAVSKERTLALFKSIARQPDAKRGECDLPRGRQQASTAMACQ